MRPLLLAVLLSGCGSGASPELYAFVFDFAMAPASCSAATPATVVSMGQLTTVNGEVWDGPEGKAFLSLEGAALSIDMGDAPTVTVTPGIALEGTPGPGGWSFVTERTSATTTPIIGTVTTTKTRAAVTFPRAGTGRGTLSLASSLTCTGTGCGTTMPSCTIDGIGVRTTRLTVNYEKAP